MGYNATFRQVKAESVKVGDRYHWLGRGYQGRTVETVARRCNCEGSSRTIDPETREPRHYPVIELMTRASQWDTEGMHAVLIPGSEVTVSNEDVNGWPPQD